MWRVCIPVRAQLSILYQTPAPYFLLTITVILVRMRFSSVQESRLARRARNNRAATLAGIGGYFELRRSHLRGRRPVRADQRLRTDENHVRAQSLILGKGKPEPSLLLSITVFSARIAFIRAESTVGAQSAQWPSWPRSDLTRIVRRATTREPARPTPSRPRSSRRCAGSAAPRPPARSGLPCRRCRRRYRGACRCLSC